MDLALKDRKWRMAVEKLVTGKKLTQEEVTLVGDLKNKIGPNKQYLDEESFFDNSKVLRMVKEVDDFRSSVKETQTLIVEDSYIRGNEQRSTEKFVLKKNTVVIFEGKFANREELQKYYDLRYRLHDSPDRTKSRFEIRSRHYNPDDSNMHIVFYNMSLVPSYEAYDKRTESSIDGFIDLKEEDWFMKNSLNGNDNSNKIKLDNGGEIEKIEKELEKISILLDTEKFDLYRASRISGGYRLDNYSDAFNEPNTGISVDFEKCVEITPEKGKWLICSAISKLDIADSIQLGEVFRSIVEFRFNIVNKSSFIDIGWLGQLPWIASMISNAEDFIKAMLIERTFIGLLNRGEKKIGEYEWYCRDFGSTLARGDVYAKFIDTTVFNTYFFGPLSKQENLKLFISEFYEEIQSGLVSVNSFNSPLDLEQYILNKRSSLIQRQLDLDIENLIREGAELIAADVLRVSTNPIEELPGERLEVTIKKEMPQMLTRGEIHEYVEKALRKLRFNNSQEVNDVISFLVGMRSGRTIEEDSEHLHKTTIIIDDIIIMLINKIADTFNLPNDFINALSIERYFLDMLCDPETILDYHLVCMDLGTVFCRTVVEVKKVISTVFNIYSQEIGESENKIKFVNYLAAAIRNGKLTDLLDNIGFIKPESRLISLINKLMFNLDKNYGHGNIVKCIVLDCDGVLWEGVIGEDGLEGIKINPVNKLLQRMVKQLKEMGVLLAINSKNNIEDVEEVLATHPDMLLKKSDFVIIKANWQDKALNMYEISKRLSISLDAIVFIDDSPQERELVKTAYPEVITLGWQSNPLLWSKFFKDFYIGRNKITEEDKRKTELYQAKEKRDNFRSQFNDIKDFYRKLDMRIIIRSDKEKNAPYIDRIAQLSQKTNQFNLTGKRYTVDYVKSILANELYRVFTLELSDIFGNAGLVGLMVVHMVNQGEWEIEEFCISCRAIGYDLEKVLMTESLITLFVYERCNKLVGRYFPTKRNVIVRSFFEFVNFDKVYENEINSEYIALKENYQRLFWRVQREWKQHRENLKCESLWRMTKSDRAIYTSDVVKISELLQNKVSNAKELDLSEMPNLADEVVASGMIKVIRHVYRKLTSEGLPPVHDSHSWSYEGSVDVKSLKKSIKNPALYLVEEYSEFCDDAGIYLGSEKEEFIICNDGYKTFNRESSDNGGYSQLDEILSDSETAIILNNSVKNNISFWKNIFEGKPKYPSIIELHLGETCNCSCMYCYNKNKLNYGTLKNIFGFQRTLGADEINMLIKDFRDMEINIVFCSGGLEFFTSKNAFYVIDKLNKAGIATVILTNGSLVHRGDMKIILESKFIRFSIDSFEKDIYKNIKRGSIDFIKVKDNLLKLIELKNKINSKTNIGVSVIVLRDNIEDLMNTIEECSKLGIDIIEIKGEYSGNLELAINIAQLRATVDKLKKTYGSNYRGMAIRFTEELLKNQFIPLTEFCWSLFDKTVIDLFGNVYPCCFWAQPANITSGMIVGNIREYGGSVRNLWEETSNFRQKIKPKENCRSCFYWDRMLNLAVEGYKNSIDNGGSLDIRKVNWSTGQWHDFLSYAFEHNNCQEAIRQIKQVLNSKSLLYEIAQGMQVPDKEARFLLINSLGIMINAQEIIDIKEKNRALNIRYPQDQELINRLYSVAIAQGFNKEAIKIALLENPFIVMLAYIFGTVKVDDFDKITEIEVDLIFFEQYLNRLIRINRLWPDLARQEIERVVLHEKEHTSLKNIKRGVGNPEVEKEIHLKIYDSLGVKGVAVWVWICVYSSGVYETEFKNEWIEPIMNSYLNNEFNWLARKRIVREALNIEKEYQKRLKNSASDNGGEDYKSRLQYRNNIDNVTKKGIFVFVSNLYLDEAYVGYVSLAVQEKTIMLNLCSGLDLYQGMEEYKEEIILRSFCEAAHYAKNRGLNLEWAYVDFTLAPLEDADDALPNINLLEKLGFDWFMPEGAFIDRCGEPLQFTLGAHYGFWAELIKLEENYNKKFNPKSIKTISDQAKKKDIGLFKVVVLDADGVLWNGIIGEDGLEGIRILSDHIEFQNALKRLKGEGILLAINSKNNLEDVREVLDKHPSMVLRKDDFAVIKANWENKFTNLKEIAQELNIGIDSMVFLDDSSQERELVRLNCPEIFVPEISANPKDWVVLLENIGLFKDGHITPEDRKRSELYAQKKLIDESTRNSVPFEKLSMTLIVRSGVENKDYMDRILQLIQRTNQFNLTLKRYSEKEFRDMFSQILTGEENNCKVNNYTDHHLYSVELIDKFGNAGVVGVIIIGSSYNVPKIIDTFCLSCRVIGYGLENAIMSYIVKHFKGNIIGFYRKGLRNSLVSDLYPQLGFQEVLSTTKYWPMEKEIISYASFRNEEFDAESIRFWSFISKATYIETPKWINIFSLDEYYSAYNENEDSQIKALLKTTEKLDNEELAKYILSLAIDKGIGIQFLSPELENIFEKLPNKGLQRKMLELEMLYLLLGIDVKIRYLPSNVKTEECSCRLFSELHRRQHKGEIYILSCEETYDESKVNPDWDPAWNDWLIKYEIKYVFISDMLGIPKDAVTLFSYI